MTEEREVNTTMQCLDALLQINFQDLEDRYSAPANFPWDWRNSLYFPFGIERLDRVPVGMKKRHLTLIVGEAESGTTSLALNIIANAAMQDLPDLPSGTISLFSVQHAKAELSMRLLSIASGVSMELMRMGKLDDVHWRSLAGAIHTLLRSDIRMLHDQNLQMDQITAACRDRDHALLILDRLDLLSSSTSEEPSQDELAAACAQMRQLANSLAVPVLLTATLPNQDDCITSTTMRQWSHAVYDNVDTIIAISRQDQQVTLRVIKNVTWSDTPIEISFDGDCMRFVA